MPKKSSNSKSSKRRGTSSVPAAKTAKDSKSGVARKGETQAASSGVAAKNTVHRPNAVPPALSPPAHGSFPAEAALSFLRDTKGAVSWPLSEMTKTLNISREESERAVALLQIQGYVQPDAHKAGEWMTTPAGETVSGAKPPRFDRATVEGALASLKSRIEAARKDRAAKFEIVRAVAFGDFLMKDRARVQAADVGVELVRRNRTREHEEIAAAHSAVEAREEQIFLRQLRGRISLINLKMYADWMGKRTHQKLF